MLEFCNNFHNRLCRARPGMATSMKISGGLEYIKGQRKAGLSKLQF